MFRGAAAKTGPTDVMRCDATRGKREKDRRWLEGEGGTVNHASGFKSDTVLKSFRSDLRE